MIKKLNIEEKKGLNLKTKVLVFLILFLIFEYLNYKFWSNYTIQSPILIKFQSPIIKKSGGYPYRQPTKTSQERANFGQILASQHKVETRKEFRPELEAIYIYFGKDIKAYAIALAESGLNCQRVSKTNDYGLFQINQVHLPKFKEDKFNCWENARVARKIYDASGWNAWVAYTNGSYINHLEQAKLLVNSYFEGR
jgi:hypothetical protein